MGNFIIKHMVKLMENPERIHLHQELVGWILQKYCRLENNKFWEWFRMRKVESKKVQFFINYVDQGIYRIGKLLPKTIVKVNWLFFINSNYVLQWRELTQNLKSCFPKNLNNGKSISYQFCTLQNWPHPAVSNSHLPATAYLSHTLLIQPHSSSQTRK